MENNNTQAAAAMTSPAGLRRSIYSLVADGGIPVPLYPKSKIPNVPFYTEIEKFPRLDVREYSGEHGAGWEIITPGDERILASIILDPMDVEMPFFLYNTESLEFVKDLKNHIGTKLQDGRSWEERWVAKNGEIKREYGTFHGIGILLRPSARCVIETDSLETDKELVKLIKGRGESDSLSTHTELSGSKKSCHRHYSRPEGMEDMKTIPGGLKAFGLGDMDIKFTGIAVVAPSLHRDGGRYEVIKDLPPLSAPRWFIDEVVRLDMCRGSRGASQGDSPNGHHPRGTPEMGKFILNPPDEPIADGRKMSSLLPYAGWLERDVDSMQAIRQMLTDRDSNPRWHATPKEEDDPGTIDDIMRSVVSWRQRRVSEGTEDRSTENSPHEPAPSHEDEQKGKGNQAERLVRYATDSGAELFMDNLSTPHVLTNGEAVPLGSRCYPWLRRLMWVQEDKTVGGEALKNAAQTLAMLAEDGGVRELHTRSAYHEGAVYYQLAKGRVVRIDPEGWEMDEDPPVVFRSVPNLKDLPDPGRGGSLDSVLDLMNLKTARDKRMMRAYLVTILVPHIGRPILQTTGVMGSGKSTASRVIKRLLDPTIPETVRVDPRDFLQKASHAYIVMLDNQNSIPEWAVDIFCRLVDKEGDSKRKHYTDDEDFIYEMRRAILLNGINPPTERGDVQDRTLPIELHRIPDDQRRGEEELWEEFGTAHPQTLGAIFDALSSTLRARGAIKLPSSPRLADWGHYAAAAYQVFGWSMETFMEDWGEVVSIQNQGTLDGAPVAQVILAFMEERERWEGLSSELYSLLLVVAKKLDLDKEQSWPQSSWLTRRIREVLPLLTAMGVSVTIPEGRKKGTRIILEKSCPG